MKNKFILWYKNNQLLVDINYVLNGCYYVNYHNINNRLKVENEFNAIFIDFITIAPLINDDDYNIILNNANKNDKKISTKEFLKMIKKNKEEILKDFEKKEIGF